MGFILVFNSGSTSLKFSLFNLPLQNEPFLKGIIEKSGNKFQLVLNGKKHRLKASNLHEAALNVKELISNYEVYAVGHRVVHGGDFFTSPTILKSVDIQKIAKLSSLAPLHNPINVEGIKIAKSLFPKTPQIAVFDTAFHSQMPMQNRVYPIPFSWYKKGIKRYGFHGINHQYCMERVEQLLGQTPKRLITCHLGGGCSLAAIKDGHSIDTTMGFTPLEGLMMATRSGSIDPGIIFHLLEKEMSLSSLKKLLNDESGLKGIAGTADMRKILQNKNQAKEELCIELFVHSLAKSIASMSASLEGIDLIAFSGGIGENAALIRELVCKKLAYLNLELDKKKNNSGKQDRNISGKKSKVQIFCIHANEEWLIAKETLKLISKSNSSKYCT